jgi:P27 family predicted phage terminase small subunit
MANRKVPDGLRLLLHPQIAAVADEQAAKIGGLGLDFDAVPTLLDDPAREEWERLSVVYADQRTRFREGDRALVIAYCCYWSAFAKAAADVAARGSVVTGRTAKDRDRVVKNPATVAMREAATQLRYLCNALGLSPDSRGRIGITDAPAQTDTDDVFGPANPFT